MNLCGITCCDAKSIPNPNRNTLEVWVIVTIPPKRIASHTLPFVPTR